MTQDEKRIAIATACGWERCRTSPSYSAQLIGSRKGTRSTCVPDYLNDLNAMHEAEKILDDNINDASSKRYVYAGHLYGETVPRNQQPFRATAEQRADAFLKTLGLLKL